MRYLEPIFYLLLVTGLLLHFFQVQIGRAWCRRFHQRHHWTDRVRHHCRYCRRYWIRKL